jgi:hypothetical protein
MSATLIRDGVRLRQLQVDFFRNGNDIDYWMPPNTYYSDRASIRDHPTPNQQPIGRLFRESPEEVATFKMLAHQLLSENKGSPSAQDKLRRFCENARSAGYDGAARGDSVPIP